jgi:hypothetical protein
MRVLQTLALPLGHRALCYSVLADALPYFSAQNDGLSNLLHRLLLLALALEGQEGFMFAQSQFPLQNALAALDKLSRFQFHEEIRIPALQTRDTDISTEQKSDAGKQLHFSEAVCGGTVGMRFVGD